MFSQNQGHQLSYWGHEIFSWDLFVPQADNVFSYSLKVYEHSTVLWFFNGFYTAWLLISSKFFRSLFPNGNLFHWIFSTAKESPVDFEILQLYILRTWQKTSPSGLILEHLINRSFFLECVFIYQLATWNEILRIVYLVLYYTVAPEYIFLGTLDITTSAKASLCRAISHTFYAQGLFTSSLLIPSLFLVQKTLLRSS